VKTAASLPVPLGRLLRLLDLDGSRGRCEHSRVAVIPADAQTRRVLGNDLVDDTLSRRLRGTLGLDDDSVSRVRLHSATSSPRLYNGDGRVEADPALAVRARRLAWRSGSGVRVVRRVAPTRATAVSGSVRQAACTASGRVPRRVRSQ
jgi:hypothetical protein